MKKNIIMLLAFVLLTGCMEISSEINIKNDDSGVLIYQHAVIEDDEIETEEGTSELEEFPGAEVTEIEYEKDGNLYVGSRVELSFSNLTEVNEMLEIIFEPEEAQKASFVRENNQVTLMIENDPDEITDGDAEMEEALYSVIIFDFIIQLEGQVIEHNATDYDRNTNTLTWNLEDQVTNGIKLVYQTDDEEIIDEGIEEEEDEVIEDEEAIDETTEDQSNLFTILIGVGILITGIVLFARKK